jgi:ATP-dependent DNA helicase RecG
MEKAGTGLKRVRDACTDNGNKVDFRFTDSFWITMHSNQDVTENVTENVTEKRHILIYRQIKLNKCITIDQLAEACKTNSRTILRDIERLKKEGFLKRIGPAKGGHWELIE